MALTLAVHPCSWRSTEGQPHRQDPRDPRGRSRAHPRHPRPRFDRVL